MGVSSKKPTHACICSKEAPSTSAAGQPSGREQAAKRKAVADSALSSFAARYRTKAQTPCPDLEVDGKGYCNRGRNCGYMHVGTDEAWATIECGLRKKANGNCIAAPHCIYKGCVEVTKDYYARMAAKRSMGVAPSEAGSDA